ncbi:MAG: CbiX/SirB N-terminal domain-containing protein [Gammaproteobacteria bacterium]|nr:CbiX/SirB N-terminal domain-containing protein [Gammaproteobacteria bacterium]
MKSLLLIAHGSRRAQSNDEVRRLAERIFSQTNSGFDEVSAAFLELAEPSIPAGLEACIQRGATEVVVFPYFLAAGRHVVDDIPQAIAPVAAMHPQVKVHIASHLGMASDLPQVILATAKLDLR